MKFKITEIEMTAEELRASRTIGENLVELLQRATEPADYYDEEEEDEDGSSRNKGNAVCLD